MKGFAIGKILEPEVKTSPKGKSYISFGLLVGKDSKSRSVFFNDKGDNSAYEHAAKLKDGDMAIIIYSSSISDKGYLNEFIDDIRLCPLEVQKAVRGVFANA